MAAVSPTAITRSPLIASACAHGWESFAVKILPLNNTASAEDAAVPQPPRATTQMNATAVNSRNANEGREADTNRYDTRPQGHGGDGQNAK